MKGPFEHSIGLECPRRVEAVDPGQIETSNRARRAHGHPATAPQRSDQAVGDPHFEGLIPLRFGNRLERQDGETPDRRRGSRRIARRKLPHLTDPAVPTTRDGL